MMTSFWEQKKIFLHEQSIANIKNLRKCKEKMIHVETLFENQRG